MVLRQQKKENLNSMKYGIHLSNDLLKEISVLEYSLFTLYKP